jgi:hypothetical protein
MAERLERTLGIVDEAAHQQAVQALLDDLRPCLHPGGGLAPRATFSVCSKIEINPETEAVSVLNLERDQYTGKGFTRVQAKGGVIRDFVPLHRDARQVLDEWLKARKDDSPTLFMTRTGRKLSRLKPRASSAVSPPRPMPGSVYAGRVGLFAGRVAPPWP